MVTVEWDVWKTVKRFPLKGGGMTQLNKIHCVLKNGQPNTTHHLTPSQFPEAEGCTSLVSSFFQPQFSLSVPFSLSPSHPFYSLISCEMRPFSGMCDLIIADNHSLFPLPLSPFLSGSAVDSGTKSVDALQRPKTACQ